MRSPCPLTVFGLAETQGVLLLVFYVFKKKPLSVVLTLYLQQGSSDCHGPDFVGTILTQCRV